MVLTFFFPPISIVDLIEDTKVRFEKQLDVIDAVLEHRDTVDTDTESQTTVDIAVDTTALEDFLVYDTCAENFDPAGALAELAALAAALEAADVDFYRRLSEREV